MILQTFSGEVSEVSEDIFQVRNRRDALNYDFGAVRSVCFVFAICLRASVVRAPSVSLVIYSKSVLSPVFTDA